MEEQDTTQKGGPLIQEIVEDEKIEEEHKPGQGIQNPGALKDMVSKQSIEKLQKLLGGGADPKSAKFREQIEKFQRMVKKHEFWDTQPVPKMIDEQVKESCPINDTTKVADIKKEPYSLPDGFQWSDINIKDDKEANDVYTLLTKNYVEDEDGDFRFDYSIEFLRWTLLVPTYKPKWHIGVRVSKSQKLVGFISGIPLTLMVDGNEIKCAEINFLCVLNNLRTKRLAPVLIKEVTRRINQKGIFQAVYTAGIYLPKPISQTKYYHRSLNPSKLVDVGFSSLPMDTKVSQLVKKYKLPKQIRNKGLRPMTKKDAPKVLSLLMTFFEQEIHLQFLIYLIRQKKFRVYTKFTLQEVSHLFLPRENVIQSFVIDDPKDPKNVSDFISFYHLPSSILKNKKHKTLYVAYSFYNVATSVELSSIIKDALIMCKQLNFDVYNSLNIMDNAKVFDELKFGQGNGNLQYYLYNWKMPSAKPTDIGIVLV